jgi:hypothetical protein
MKPWDKVSSFRGANTLFQGQQINGQTQKEERHRREITEDHRREIKGAIRDADQGRSKQQIQRETRTAPRHNVRGPEYIVNRDCNDD